jgi:putative IMPACT (imprinted ancient) family translation regulator
MNFDDRVKNAVQEMITLGYKPKAFMSMTFQYGTINAIKKLINSSGVSDGFTKLWELKRLDLSMENIIQEKEWNHLFSDDEREKAKKRLLKYKYVIKK